MTYNFLLPNSTTGSRAFQGMDPRNILEGKRSRRNAHSAKKLTRYSGYHFAFSLAIRVPEKLRIHRNTLPQAPRTFRQISKHIHSAQFQQACDKEMSTLLEKKMFDYIDEKDVPENEIILPLIPTCSTRRS